MFLHRVVQSSGSSTFLAKITHNYSIKNVTVELKLIKIDKIDKNSKIKTGRLSVAASCKQISILINLYSTF
jgi:hypothetical protein